jgi:deoxynucleoside triphosphate triphosphohydrolase SAMHD1
MVEHLRDTQPELGITNREVECVELAGLCHDLGHGPFSHVWDSHFIPQALYAFFTLSIYLSLIPDRKGKKWKHEDASEMMFDDLVSKNDIDISEQDIRFVKALIAGDADRCSYVLYPIFMVYR